MPSLTLTPYELSLIRKGIVILYSAPRKLIAEDPSTCEDLLKLLDKIDRA